MTTVRLQKFLSQAGVASRRKAEKLISLGKIKINNKIITKLGTTVDADKDEIIYNNKIIKLDNSLVYIALNKPAGYITSNNNTQGKTVFDLIKYNKRLFPIGRLDKDSTGLLILTNDGEFAQRVSHASFGCEKEYFVTLDQDLRLEDIKKLEKGLDLGQQHAAPIKVVAAQNKSARLVLTQGLSRQIRRSLGKLGYSVFKLKRVRIGKLELDKLALGKTKIIFPQDVIG